MIVYIAMCNAIGCVMTGYGSLIQNLCSLNCVVSFCLCATGCITTSLVCVAYTKTIIMQLVM